MALLPEASQSNSNMVSEPFWNPVVDTVPNPSATQHSSPTVPQQPQQQAATGTPIPDWTPDMSRYPGFTNPGGGILYNPSSDQIDYSQLGPHTREVGQEELVRHHMEGLLAADSLYMDQARLAGERAAASRGALSSSIFAGASQAAAIEAALPIAQQDAQTYSRVASENAAAINQNTLAKMQSMSALAQATMNANTNMEVARMRIVADQQSRQFMAAHDQVMSAIQHGQTLEMMNLDHGFKTRLMQAGFQHDVNMRELAHEQQQQIMFMSQEYALEQMGYQGSIKNFLQDQQLRNAFLNNGMGNIFQAINLLNQEGVDGPAFETATQNIWNTFGNFMDIFNSLSNGGFNFNFGPQTPTGP